MMTPEIPPALSAEDRADIAIAALCLRGHPFGFTEADASLCRSVARDFELSALDIARDGFPKGLETTGTVAVAVNARREAAQRLRDLADRIAALLSAEASP